MEKRDNEPCGVLVVNKHKGVTSHDIVNKVRRLYGTRRVGHTGTLDPLATGVLVVLVGRAAKASEYLTCDSKRYNAVMRLGLTTDTEDITGNVLSTSDNIPSSEEIIKVCETFCGKIMQTPPMYSALKVNGEKLVDLARRGVVVERVAREVEIFSIDCSKRDKNSDYGLAVHCSSGTYIRTLCADIGNALGCGAVMAELERVETGNFGISKAHTIEELENMSQEERFDLLLPIEKLFVGLKSVCFDTFYEKLSRNGCEIYQKKIKTDLKVGSRVRMCDKSGSFYALGEVREYPDGTAIKAIKLFDLG